MQKFIRITSAIGLGLLDKEKFGEDFDSLYDQMENNPGSLYVCTVVDEDKVLMVLVGVRVADKGVLHSVWSDPVITSRQLDLMMMRFVMWCEEQGVETLEAKSDKTSYVDLARWGMLVTSNNYRSTVEQVEQAILGKQVTQ